MDTRKTPDLEQQLRVANVRLTMAQAFVRMLETAFDALLHHGVNYRNLPEYKDETLLDEARTLPLSAGQASYHKWMERVESAIRAAIRRKGFKDVNSPNKE